MSVFFGSLILLWFVLIAIQMYLDVRDAGDE